MVALVVFLIGNVSRVNATDINDGDIPINANCSMFSLLVDPDYGVFDTSWSEDSWGDFWGSNAPWSPDYAGLAVGLDSDGYYVRVRFQLSESDIQAQGARFHGTTTRVPTALVVGVKELGGQWEPLGGGDFKFSISSSNIPNQALLIKGLNSKYEGGGPVLNRMAFLILRPEFLQANHLYEVVMRPQVWTTLFLDTSFKLDFSVAANWKLIEAYKWDGESYICDFFITASYLLGEVQHYGVVDISWTLVEEDFPPEIPVKARTEWYYYPVSPMDSLQDNVFLTWGEQPVSCWSGEGSNHGPVASPSKCDGIFKAPLGQEYSPGAGEEEQQCFFFFGRHYCITLPPVPRWGR